VDHQAQREWERAAGRPAATAAFLAAVLTVVSFAIRAPYSRDAAAKHARHLKGLVSYDKHASTLLVSAVIGVVALLLLAVVLFYLYRASRYRRPEIPAFIAPLILIAPVCLGAGLLAAHFDLKHIAHDFLQSGPRTDARAKHALENTSPVVTALNLAGGLGVALSLVLTNVNALRVGLVSRFVGIVGVIVGALQVLPLLPQFVLEMFWLGALGLVFLDRWPGGRGPAWDSGEAIPWPTAAERAEERAGEAAPLEEDAAPEPGPEAAPEPERPAHPRSKKRKRKRRR
jgi:hypothetical protein